MNIGIDLGGFWTWFLLWVRFTSLLTVLPGIGTEEIPTPFRALLAVALSFVLVVTGASAVAPESLLQGLLMITSEIFLGYLIGVIPSLVVASAAIAGQLTAGVIGLGQASMIDHSLGEQSTTIGRLQSLLASVIFLLVNGHHTVIRAVSKISGDVGIGMFHPGEDTFQIFLERFKEAFSLAIVIASPILVTILVTQFVLGLLTKFVPQVNVFIISLPLTVGVGLFVLDYTLPAFVIHVAEQFGAIEESVERMFLSSI
jgi:flagellar biosynthetic protein FliR